MTYALIQDFATLDEPGYRRVVAELGPEPVEGQLVHLCVRRPDGRLRLVQVWESRAALDAAIADRVRPAFTAVFGAEGVEANRMAEVTELDVLDMAGTLVDASAR